MLMLPLGLTGEYGEILYSSFASQGYLDHSQISSQNVLSRFLDGGHIDFDYAEKVVFDPLTLTRLADEFRKSVVKSECGFDQTQDGTLEEETNPELENRSYIRIAIDDNIVKQFCEFDVMIGPYYQQALSYQFTFPNKFFNSLSIGVSPETEPGVVDTRPLIIQLMKDAAILRILEVALYVWVPSSFWENLSNGWKFCN